MGNDMLMPYITQCYEKRQPLGALHRKALDYFRTYMIVGGMPQAVQTFVQSRDFDKVDRVKRGILQVYTNDISKYAEGVEHKVKSIFDQIPAQLQKHEKKFRLSALEPGAAYRDYDDAFFWLADAGIVNICYNCTAPNVGLRLNMERNTLKCYMADTGLLISHTFDEKGKVPVEIYQKLLLNKLEVNQGMIVENIVAQMLAANNHKLYFYTNSSRDNASDRMEIDFLIAKSSKVVPIEVKSSNYKRHASLDAFCQKYSAQIAEKYILYTKDFQKEQDIRLLPIYMSPFI